MRNFIAFILALVCVLSLIGCNQQNTTEPTQITEPNTKLEIVEPHISIPDFSYAEDSETYADGEPGVKTFDFVNISEIEIDFDNVVERAKNECTIQWDTTTTYLDAGTGIWKVVFSTEGILGGCQSVYLNDSGKTLLIVYGE